MSNTEVAKAESPYGSYVLLYKEVYGEAIPTYGNMVALSKSVYGVVVNPYKDLIPPAKSEVPLSKVV